MKIKKFNLEEDFNRLEAYLRLQYLKNKNMTSWLPQRFNDLVYRINKYEIHQGRKSSMDFIYIFENQDEIIGCILPDGDAIYISIKEGYENKFKEIVEYAEANCQQLFSKNENGSIDFLVIANDSNVYKADALKEMGYRRDEVGDYDNCIYPQNYNPIIELPEGYRIAYGDEITDEFAKWSACSNGFHPDYEKDPNHIYNMSDYNGRKESHMYKDSFECMIVTEENDICSYCFVYVDKQTKSAFIEPVSTREKYRHKGIGSAMLNSVAQKCKELGIEKCYVNSFDWRVKFYNAAGFTTEDTIGFWHKKI